ncbi:uncharacterized protein TEOVI_000164500 [Trypanosoma equiperdum]|uniref:Uncharacterized protein n=2 Tax=Trypanozoon TaxID=39700 RepID=A0A1G4ICW1_TRYEQ|nr:hypothetical protein DPX39_100086400 [Trypanosoma brucei equiperdum]SCU70076.1 hypothetical protein, conserved [Trypanosoma equiperdum]
MGTKENATKVVAGNYPYSSVARGEHLVSHRSPPRALKWLAPAALLFAAGGFYFTCRWNNERAKDGPCINCKRQQEIIEEVYFNKQTVQKGNRL